MPSSLSFLRALCLLWALVILPLAAALLWNCVTGTGVIFAVASLCIGLAPWLRCLDEERVWLRRAGAIAIGLWFLLSAWVIWRSPDGHTPAGSRVRNQFADGTWQYDRHALGAMIPEVDQLLLGCQLVPSFDASFSRSQGRELGALIRPVYRELDADPDFHALGSAMPEAYDDLWGRRFARGHSYVYVPLKLDKTKPAPVLVFLHGYGGNFKAYTWILSRVADKLGMVLVAPSFGLGNWEPKHGPIAVAGALESAARVVPLDRSRLYLAGLFNGGLGVSQTAATTVGQQFRSLVFLSPGFDYVAIHSPLFQSKWRGKHALVITGGKDDPAQLASVQEAVSHMKDVGVAVEAKIFEDADHFLFFNHREAMVKALIEWLRADAAAAIGGRRQPS